MYRIAVLHLVVVSTLKIFFVICPQLLLFSTGEYICDDDVKFGRSSSNIIERKKKKVESHAQIRHLIILRALPTSYRASLFAKRPGKKFQNSRPFFPSSICPFFFFFFFWTDTHTRGDYQIVNHLEFMFFQSLLTFSSLFIKIKRQKLKSIFIFIFFSPFKLVTGCWHPVL